MVMATTEEENNSVRNTPYPEMILAAIAALGEKDGSSKSSITKYIETTYAGTLREGYTAAISDALTKLNESGELLFADNLYIKSDHPLPRRGRGRPRKPKPTLPPGSSPPTPRPRGRPPKPKGFKANSVKSVGGIPGRRGRPPKPKNSNAAAAKSVGGVSRRRGRPPKKHWPVVPSASIAVPKGDGAAPAVLGVKRGRGRPPKVKPAAAEPATVPATEQLIGN